MITIDEVADLVIRLNGLLGQAHLTIQQLEAKIKVLESKLESNVREPDEQNQPKTASVDKE